MVRIAGSHPAGPGSIPGAGKKLLFCLSKIKRMKGEHIEVMKPPGERGTLNRVLALLAPFLTQPNVKAAKARRNLPDFMLLVASDL